MAGNSPHFDKTRFLAQYWQKKPVVLKSFFQPFEDLIDENDLAGIAQEPNADSRIVSRDENEVWRNTAGPFDDFNTVCIGAWSLLVQGTEQYIPEIDDLFEEFSFVPYWRMDDVMVSYSVKGAGVGAHIDQYDVFLIQGKGKRRWQIGKPGDFNELDNNGLRQISEFEPIIDVITEQGDVIYIPPGWPHKGETIENSLTYSIGFRAPDTEQLVNILHETIDAQSKLNRRFSDPKRDLLSKPAMVGTKDIAQLKTLLTDLIAHQDFDNQLLSMLSDCPIDDNQTSDPMALEETRQALVEQRLIKRAEGVRPIYAEQQRHNDRFEFHINGEQFNYDAALKCSIEPILNNRESVCQFNGEEPSESLCLAVSQLIESGYFYLE